MPHQIISELSLTELYKDVKFETVRTQKGFIYVISEKKSGRKQLHYKDGEKIITLPYTLDNRINLSLK